jgi:hypothetical protein
MVMDTQDDMLEQQYTRVLTLLDGMPPDDALHVLGHACAEVIAQTVIGPEDQDKVIAELVSFIHTTICDIEQDGLIH